MAELKFSKSTSCQTEWKTPQMLTSSFKLGRLKNGNSPGNPLLASRCGATSKRAGVPCRQPAMRNGRCRLHGGHSTGPKTQAGLLKCRSAKWKDGSYCKEAIARKREIAMLLKECKEMLKRLRVQH